MTIDKDKKADENTSFLELGLSSPILKALNKQGYDAPSPIQSKAIPIILKGKDIMAAAQTGTGKTLQFSKFLGLTGPPLKIH